MTPLVLSAWNSKSRRIARSAFTSIWSGLINVTNSMLPRPIFEPYLKMLGTIAFPRSLTTNTRRDAS